MIAIDRIRTAAADPAIQRWAAAGAGVVGLHLVVLIAMASMTPKPWPLAPERPVAPIYLDITPLVRPARTPPTRQSEGGPAASPVRAPVIVRPADRPDSSEQTPPLVVDLPPTPIRPRAPGRVIPQSWRNRCNLPDGEISDAAYRACRDSFLGAAAPPGPAIRPRGDPAQDFAAQGAARIRAYEAQRAPAPTGSGNARPSATPGSNFGMGEVDRSVIYVQGQRPETGP